MKPRSLLFTALAFVIGSMSGVTSTLRAADQTPPPVGVPFPLIGAPEYMAAPGDQSDPAVAFGGGNYLTVWVDKRLGPENCVYGARVSPDGTLLDPAGFAISSSDTKHSCPAVAFDGANFFVVWTEFRWQYWAYDIFGARVSAGGQVLDPAGIVISSAASIQNRPSIAFDGTNFLVVWEDYRNLNICDVYCARVSTSGVVLDPDGVPVSTAAIDQRHPSVAFDGTNYLVVWEDCRNDAIFDIYGARLDVGCNVLDTLGIPISSTANHQINPSLAYGADGYFAVWLDYRDGLGPHVYGTRISPLGQPIDTSGIALCTRPGAQRAPEVSFDGDDYWVAWTDSLPGTYGSVLASRVNALGTVMDTAGIVVTDEADHAGYSQLACGPTNCQVVWMARALSNRYDIFGARVDLAGTVIDTAVVLMSRASASQEVPVVASDGTNYLAVWAQSGGDSPGIHAAQVDPFAQVLDQEEIILSSAGGTKWNPAVVFGDSAYLVVWEDSRNGNADIYGARISPEGTVLDTAGIPITTAAAWQAEPAVSFNGTEYLVVWRQGGTFGADIYCARVSVGGEVLDPGGLQIAATMDEYSEPAVCSDGENFLVSWSYFVNSPQSPVTAPDSSDEASVGISETGLCISVVSGAGTAFGQKKVPASWQSLGRASSVASDGTDYLLVWAGRPSSYFGSYGIFGVRVSSSGLILDSTARTISPPGIPRLSPAIVFDGEYYRVVWDDGRSGTYGDVYGARVTPDGDLLETDGIAITATEYPDAYPAIAAGPFGGSFIVCSSFTPAVYGSRRTWGNFWGESLPLLFTGVSAEPSRDRVALAWEVNFDAPAASFSVERSDSATGGFVPLQIAASRLNPFTFSAEDNSVAQGKTYWYRIVFRSPTGSTTSNPVQVSIEAIPAAYSLYRAYPNPFVPACTIRFDLPEPAMVDLAVFSVSGALVRTLIHERKESGAYSEVWDGKGNDGGSLGPGVYVYRLKAGPFVESRKIVLLQ